MALCFQSSTRMTGFDLKKQFLSRFPQYSSLQTDLETFMRARLPLKAVGRGSGWVFSLSCCAFRPLIFFCKVKIHPISLEMSSSRNLPSWIFFMYSFSSSKYIFFLAFTNFCHLKKKWYFVTKIVLTYCEKKMF